MKSRRLYQFQNPPYSVSIVQVIDLDTAGLLWDAQVTFFNAKTGSSSSIGTTRDSFKSASRWAESMLQDAIQEKTSDINKQHKRI